MDGATPSLPALGQPIHDACANPSPDGYDAPQVIANKRFTPPNQWL
jgi:hypothetical protein